MAVPDTLSNRLTLPAIAAPMTSVSGPDLVIAACRNGVIGAFPTHNAATTRQLDAWLRDITAALNPDGTARIAPVAPNLVVHRTNDRLREDLDCLVRHGVELVITSVGSPQPVIAPLHAIGCRVFADVSSMAHVRRALDAGVDGLVLLTAGAGGQTGWANPFAFVRAVRPHFDGPIVLAGGVSDGASMLAAQVLGADLVYLGTRFIATTESSAGDDYRAALVESTLDDVRLSTRVGGIPASLLTAWLALDDESPPAIAAEGFQQDRLLRNRTAWSAGHSVAGVDAITSVDELVRTLTTQYELARNALAGFGRRPAADLISADANHGL
ncbi:nitronate monooxygenase [Nocardia sp. NBC_00565]|uniref:NAD(P)H-dependent flavin oxidoreductase n=1 Tax=Nocardia sp. NBC_00565 TaxID=2975993 RepID=UPI002E807867|nr:nitronate monooxygenase [Nocardia sp. NBC_00565]WUC06704.1 nitronate monooxygenase [Nocardia sp. NBC_00565]